MYVIEDFVRRTWFRIVERLIKRGRAGQRFRPALGRDAIGTRAGNSCILRELVFFSGAGTDHRSMAVLDRCRYTDMYSKRVVTRYARAKQDGKKEKKERQRESRVERERTICDWDWERAVIGFQVPGRLRPSAPIKGRGAMRTRVPIFVFSRFLCFSFRYFIFLSYSIFFYPFFYFPVSLIIYIIRF